MRRQTYFCCQNCVQRNFPPVWEMCLPDCPRDKEGNFLLGPQQLDIKIHKSGYDLQGNKLSLVKCSFLQAENYLTNELQSQFPNLLPSQRGNTPVHGGIKSVRIQGVIIISITQNYKDKSQRTLFTNRTCIPIGFLEVPSLRICFQVNNVTLSS